MITSVFAIKLKIEKDRKYADRRKQDAVDFLANNSLNINEDQAKKTNKLIKENQLNTVVKKYNQCSISKKFENQPVGVQTAVVSICFQYGSTSKHLKICGLRSKMMI